MAVKRRKPKPLLFIFIFLAVICIAAGGAWVYLSGPVEAGNDEVVDVEISSGTSTRKIGEILEEKGLIHSQYMFMIYVKLYKVNNLKASTYQMNKGMDLNEIINVLQEGSTYNPNAIKLTFKEGQRITDFAKTISDNTNNDYDSIITMMKDRNYISKLITNYWFLTDVILDDDIYYPLEGYLAPDTYYFDNKDVDVDTIINTMLKEMDNKLSSYKSVIGNDVHKYMTMASIVELEGTNTENRKMIVGVFNNRLSKGMNLGSDVTTYYGLQADMKNDLTSQQFNTVNAYNTRSTTMMGKLPIGPICNPSLSSIEASIEPTDNDYLFFVADKHGKIYYTKTMKEHEAKIAEIKANGDWIF